MELELEEGAVEVEDLASDDVICECAIKQEVRWRCAGAGAASD